MTDPSRDSAAPSAAPSSPALSAAGTDRLVAWGQELRSVHARLRDALEVAREAVTVAADDGSTPADADPRRLIGLYCHGFCQALEGHHRGEDGSVFTALLDLRPDLADVVAELQRDHTMLDHLLGGLARAVDAGADAAALDRHLDGIDAVMETHFRYEEKRLVDALDEPALAAALAGTDRRVALGPLA
ncbi:hemerythrin domain-containing protein [Krasilnikoviella flava]|uniref:Hemerythrin HHE cation binding domain-containing protein n=1 Tax=Krasilnikoviella flava TaxID=526729 RepID=A0A1T5K3R3_9MICO|nr:hemerythrin domain-containing protein [Krasilnikoviella flava]SKC58283.1 Hemerythrin HHE cation binding domain-containing protein [Krasilnikoviella flava]